MMPTRTLSWLVAGLLAVCPSAGCTTWSPSEAWDSWSKPSAALPPPPAETILRAGHWDAQDAQTPGTLAGEVGLSQSALSQHLARMRDEGIVDYRRESQTLRYRISDPRIEKLMATLYRLYCSGA